MPEGEGDKAAEGTASDDPIDSGVDRIRDTAKWLVTGFGALGAALITSLQLRDVGQLSGTDEILALAGFAIGIAGILVALLGTASVLSAHRVGLGELKSDPKLRNYIEKNPELLGGYKTLDEVYEQYQDASQDRIRAYSQRLKAAKNEDVERHKGEYDKANLRLDLVNPVVAQLLAASLFERVRNHWARVVLPLIAVGVVLATVGVGLFTSRLTEKKADQEASLPPTPVRAVMDLTTEGQEQFANVLGSDCDLSAIDVVILNSSDDQWELVTADDGCNTRQLDVSQSEAAVVSCELATTGGDKGGGENSSGTASSGLVLVSAEEETTTTTVPLPERPSGGPCAPFETG